MKTDTDALAKDLISLPRTFSKGDVSICALLKDSGYFQMRRYISRAVIRRQLETYPDCVDEWLSYSEDQRCSSGHYLEKNGDNYVVGYWDGTKKVTPTEFGDRFEACALFIKRVIEDIRQRV